MNQHFTLIKLSLSIVILMTLIFSQTTVSRGISPMETKIVGYKNLKNQDYKDRLAISTAIDGLYAAAKGDPYQLSMPLLASAQQGNLAQYRKILPQMKKALKNISEDGKQNAYKAWLMGRVILAADSIDDQATLFGNHSEAGMITQLETILKDPATTQDCFSAWAFAYLAAVNSQIYGQVRDKMLSYTVALTHAYRNKLIHREEQDKSDIQSLRSNALWAQVMVLQAAANANDKTTYDQTSQQIKMLVGKPTVSEALSQGLLRTSDSNDYPAWAMGIVRASAATIGDEAIYKELAKPLANSIHDANEAHAKAEAILARLNEILAENKWHRYFTVKNEGMKHKL